MFGEIRIGNNCFIGARTVILPGVSLADTTIVAAGSVVTKSVSETGTIIGGNPARFIGRTGAFAEKMAPYAVCLGGLSETEKKSLIMATPHIEK